MGILANTLGLAANTIKGAGASAVYSAINQAAQGDLEGAIGAITGGISSTVETLGAYGSATPGDALRGMNARSDAMQSWSWYCLLPSLSNTGTELIGGINASVALPWYYVQKGNTPFRTFEVESITRNSRKINLPTGYSVPSLSLEFFMDSSGLAQKYLKAWAGLVLGNDDPSNIANVGTWGYPAAYKKNIYLYLLSVTKKQLLNFKYIGCWPSDPQALELVSDDGQPMSQSVAFHVEDVQVTVLNDKGLIENLANTGQGYAMSALTGIITG